MGTIRLVPAILVLLACILCAACLSSPSDHGTPSGSPVITTATPQPSACGFTSCHGLDLSCGENVPEACTAIYQLGDKCRQYAFCRNTGGSCELVTTDEFARCKSCVGKCGGADATEIFVCEEKC